jgi:glycosyltransferase 2 family protein
VKTDFRGKILFSLAFGALVFICLTVYADAEKLASAFAAFDWSFAPVILACSSANYLFRYWKWDYYTATLGIRPSTSQNIIIFLAAFMMAVTPGKLGEVLKSYLLKGVNDTPITKSAPIIIAERLTDFIGLMVLIVAGAYVFGYARGLIVLFAVFFTSVTILLSWRRGSLALLRFIERIPLINRYSQHALSGYESIHQLLRPKVLSNAVLLSIAAWACECLGFWIILNDFKVPPSFLKAVFIYSFSTIVGAVSMLPGGLGTTEGSLTGLTMLAGAPKGIAVASTFIIRAATLWYAVAIGIVVTFFFQKKLNVRIAELPLVRDRETA